ncbi:MAG: hypothetical protein CM15mP23_00800 [Cryomorphaceae bacterium]|nr:MAG: hypothetical protein CM15mP23_00800 [Cryomorphaceae bacterium]
MMLLLSNPDTSFRSRNWFRVNWNIAAFNLDYKFNQRTKLNSRTFGLWSSRDALGLLDRIDWPETGQQRDLLLAKFNNFGNETRLIHRYLIGKSESVFCLEFDGTADSQLKNKVLLTLAQIQIFLLIIN